MKVWQTENSKLMFSVMPIRLPGGIAWGVLPRGCPGYVARRLPEETARRDV